jgi:hypothetical protein
MKTIKLTNSEAVVLVSDEDFERVNQHKWFLKRAKGQAGYYYAARSYRDNGKVKTMWLHRFLTDAKSGEDVHHKDRDKLNCQRDNMQCTDPATHGGLHDDIPF